MTATTPQASVGRVAVIGDVQIRFSRRELLDLAAAWLALGVAFTVFLEPELRRAVRLGVLPDTAGLVRPFALSIVTVGVGFLLHELAHKVVAINFGQIAEFRADYTMLGMAVVIAFAGILFAAPGAVHHRGRITARENGLIALAGPAANGILAVAFVPVVLLGGGFLAEVGEMGVIINVFLGAFNMIPFGPLDGRKVLAWSRAVYVMAVIPAAWAAVYVFLAMF